MSELLGDCVLTKREKLGLSRKALADKIGISAEYVRLIELGLRTPANPVRVALESALNQEKNLENLIYKEMINYGSGDEGLAKLLAEKITVAGYRRKERFL